MLATEIGDLEDLSLLFIYRVHENGFATFKELVEHCRKEQIGLKAGELVYYAKQEVRYALIMVALIYQRDGIVEPVLENESQRRALQAERRRHEVVSLESGSEEEIAIIDQIKWRFTDEGRKRFLARKIYHPDYLDANYLPFYSRKEHIKIREFVDDRIYGVTYPDDYPEEEEDQEYFLWSFVRRFMSETGAKQVERNAVDYLISELKDEAISITEKALVIAKHDKHKLITVDDILFAIKSYVR